MSFIPELGLHLVDISRKDTTLNGDRMEKRPQTKNEDLICAAKNFIETRRAHYAGVVTALELCITRSPDAPTSPQTALVDACDVAEKSLRDLLPGDDEKHPIVLAARAVFACFAPRHFRRIQPGRTARGNSKETKNYNRLDG